MTPKRAVAGGGIGLIVLAVAAMIFGIDPGVVMQIGQEIGVGQQSRQPVQRSAAEAEQVEFVKVVLADTEDTWNTLFAQAGLAYREPRLVLFSGAVNSACGYAQAAMGPFYCPEDQKVYIDLQFYQELTHKFGAPGDFAQAYVIAHEIGHHVQTLLGISDQVRQAQSGSSKTEGNAIQVGMELQADCFAGVWAHHANRTRHLLEQGDIEEGLNAAAAIGDDTLQRKAQGRVVPESFTHGSSKQRQHWFSRGLQTGNIPDCNTFAE